MQYQLYRSKRKTIAISLDRDGNLTVKAPHWVSIKDIEYYLLQKQEWIEAVREGILKQNQEIQGYKLENGDLLYYLGEKRELTVYREERSRAKVKSAMERIFLWISYEADYSERQNAIVGWYRKQAKELLRDKTEAYSSLMKVHYADIHIKDQKSRWGSCSSKGNLNFNWRIIMAPESVCDYVVIHELCHLVHMNHSEQFWKLVESYCPPYKQYQKWLKDNAKQLHIF